MAKLLIIRGIPGTGKSTLAHKLVCDGEYRAFFEADQYFMTESGYDFDPSKLHAAHAFCRTRVIRNRPLSPLSRRLTPSGYG